jgi:uncharacterized membrane protein YbhN (UPF0104 family)
MVMTALLPWASRFGWERWISPAQALNGCLVGIALISTYLVLCARGKGVSIRGHRIELLPLGPGLSQALTSAANWAWMGLVMSLCLGPEIGYAEALGALLASAIAGAIAHVPGGWGVLEFVVVALLADRLPQSELIASVLVYRVAYYLVPLPAAIVAYLALGKGSGGTTRTAQESTSEPDLARGGSTA